jgi:hypothetical protein
VNQVTPGKRLKNVSLRRRRADERPAATVFVALTATTYASQHRQGFAQATDMKNSTTNNIGDTIRIRRPPRVFTNEKGDSIWMSDVEPIELEIEPDRITGTDPYDSWRSVSY